MDDFVSTIWGRTATSSLKKKKSKSLFFCIIKKSHFHHILYTFGVIFWDQPLIKILMHIKDAAVKKSAAGKKTGWNGNMVFNPGKYYSGAKL